MTQLRFSTRRVIEISKQSFLNVVPDAMQGNAQQLENFDQVSIEAEPGVWIIVQTRDPEPKYQVQLGRDAATVRWVNTGSLTLLKKAQMPDTGPGFYPPGKGIMG